MINFLGFTLNYFSFRFALWILHICSEPSSENQCRWFWNSINSDPFFDCSIEVEVSTIYTDGE